MTNKGFTLIELVIVIVVLGILSAIAIPKFISMQNDAHLATFKSEAAAIQSGLHLVHSKAQIGPIVDGELIINGQSITINPATMSPIFENPNHADITEKIQKEIIAFVDIDLSRFDYMSIDDGFILWPNTFKAKVDATCSVEYIAKVGVLSMQTIGCI